MEIFSPVVWLRMTYSLGEDAARILTRVLAASRSAAASIQRRPLLSTLKMSNGGIMGWLTCVSEHTSPLMSIYFSGAQVALRGLPAERTMCLKSQTVAKLPNGYRDCEPSDGASDKRGPRWETGQSKPNQYRKGDQADASHCGTCGIEGGRVLPSVSRLLSRAFLFLPLVFLD